MAIPSLRSMPQIKILLNVTKSLIKFSYKARNTLINFDTKMKIFIKTFKTF